MIIRIMVYHSQTPELVEKLKAANCYFGQEFRIDEGNNSIARFNWPDVGVLIGRIHEEGLNIMLQQMKPDYLTGEPLTILWIDNGRFQQR